MLSPRTEGSTGRRAGRPPGPNPISSAANATDYLRRTYGARTEELIDAAGFGVKRPKDPTARELLGTLKKVNDALSHHLRPALEKALQLAAGSPRWRLILKRLREVETAVTIEGFDRVSLDRLVERNNAPASKKRAPVPTDRPSPPRSYDLGISFVGLKRLATMESTRAEVQLALQAFEFCKSQSPELLLPRPADLLALEVAIFPDRASSKEHDRRLRFERWAKLLRRLRPVIAKLDPVALRERARVREIARQVAAASL